VAHPWKPESALRLIRVIHTLVWAFFALCIIAIPFLAWSGRLGAALVTAGIVMIEVAVILANRWRCPLTPLAARYTTDRRANFDIYLPEWLARHNKTIFGILFVAGLLFTLVDWLARAR
jgi:hypothetical protein